MLIDVHTHIGLLTDDEQEFMEADDLIAKMDAWGIDRACVLPLSEHPEGGYLHCYTRDVLRACAEYPARLVPFCLIPPETDSMKTPDVRDQLEEYVELGCKGFGEFLPKLDFDDPRCISLYQQAGAVGLPVLFDMQDRPDGYGLRDSYGLPRLERALQLCPDTLFIGHGPTFWAEISAEVPDDKRSQYPTGPVVKEGAVSRLLRAYPNMAADISAASGHNAICRDMAFGIEFLNEFQDKLMFGTDSCKRSELGEIWRTVRLVRSLEEQKALSSSALAKLKWKNAVDLLGLQQVRSSE